MQQPAQAHPAGELPAPVTRITIARFRSGLPARQKRQQPFGPKRVVVNEILMAGDSAGLITPLAGDGIGMALRGAQMAAERLLAFLAGRQTAAQACEGYARDWRRQFAGRVRLGRLLQVFMLRPRLLGFGLRVLNVAPGMGEFVVTHTREVQKAQEER